MRTERQVSHQQVTRKSRSLGVFPSDGIPRSSRTRGRAFVRTWRTPVMYGITAPPAHSAPRRARSSERRDRHRPERAERRHGAQRRPTRGRARCQPRCHLTLRSARSWASLSGRGRRALAHLKRAGTSRAAGRTSPALNERGQALQVGARRCGSSAADTGAIASKSSRTASVRAEISHRSLPESGPRGLAARHTTHRGAPGHG